MIFTKHDIDSIPSIGKVAKENLHTMTEELKAFEQERKRRKATESQGETLIIIKHEHLWSINYGRFFRIRKYPN